VLGICGLFFALALAAIVKGVLRTESELPKSSNHFGDTFHNSAIIFGFGWLPPGTGRPAWIDP
jgi:hypothetical protein